MKRSFAVMFSALGARRSRGMRIWQQSDKPADYEASSANDDDRGRSGNRGVVLAVPSGRPCSRRNGERTQE
jgi:hypothetical protein